MGNELTPDVIRETALKLIARRPEGIKQAQLFKDTESELSSAYEVPEFSVKNALWDLQDRYPMFVEKKKLSPRNVIIYPTTVLLHEQNCPDLLNVPEGGYDESVMPPLKSDAELKNAKLTMFLYKVLEVARYVDMSEIEETAQEIIRDYSSELNPQELEALFGVKSLVRQFKTYRNNLAHGGKIRDLL